VGASAADQTAAGPPAAEGAADDTSSGERGSDAPGTPKPSPGSRRPGPRVRVRVRVQHRSGIAAPVIPTPADAGTPAAAEIVAGEADRAAAEVPAAEPSATEPAAPPPAEPEPAAVEEPATEVPDDRRASERPAGARTPGLWIAVASVGYAIMCLLQAPGRLVADTKLDIPLEPWRFMSAAAHLWTSTSDFGLLQNQSVGYLFPMGPFFLLGHLLGVPPWITQRLWMALILSVATWGVIRLADTLGIGRPAGRVVAGAVYATSPFMLGKLGSNSIALTAAAMLPWMIIPLARTIAIGGEAAAAAPRWSPRRGAALSGLAVFATGGVNASVTIDVLVCPAIYLVLIGTSRNAWKLRAWWLAAVVMATAWWIIPLGLQSQYGVNFLPFTETATITTSTSSVGEALRGASDWMAYLSLPSPWLPAATEYVTTPLVVLGSAIVAAIGLWGLARRDLPSRRFLVVSLAVGLLAIGAAYPNGPHSPLAGTVRDLLTSPFGFLRNVYKFQPAMRLPLALGVAHALSGRAQPGWWAARAPARPGGSWPRGARRPGWPRRRPDALVRPGLGPVGRRPGLGPVGRLGAGLLAVAAILAGMTPVLAGRMTPSGSFTNVPDYWVKAAAYLAAQPSAGRTLVLPGTAFGEYDWGRPLDEPMQWLAGSPWGERSLVPLGGVGVTRWLDGVEQALALGDGTGLATALARADVGQLLVRNDLQNKDWDVPPSTDQIHRALAGSGLRAAASFGPRVAARSAAKARLVPALRNPSETVPALEVWEVPGGARAVTAYPAANAMVVSGGSEATVQLANQGLLDNTRAVVLAGDLADNPNGHPNSNPNSDPNSGAAGPGDDLDSASKAVVNANSAVGAYPPAADVLGPDSQWLVTDTYTRRDYNFGLVHSSASYVLAARQAVAGQTTPPAQWVDRPTAGHQTVAYYTASFADGRPATGPVGVSASSYGFQLAAAPDLAPYNVLDTDPGSVWQAVKQAGTSVGQWIRVDVGRSVSVQYLTVEPLDETPLRPAVRALRVTTATGSVVTRVSPDERPQRIAVPPGPTSWFQVSFAELGRQDASNFLGPGLRTLTIPGVSIQRSLRAPADESEFFSAAGSGPVDFSFARNRSDPSLPFSGDEERQLVRTFDVPKTEDVTITGTAIPINDRDRPETRTGPLLLPCGAGPTVVIDGVPYSSQVGGTYQDIGAVTPMALTVCAPYGKIRLGAGRHTIVTWPAQQPMSVGALTLRDTARPAAATPRTTTVTAWTAERRTVTIAAGAQAFLAVRENANPAWTATLDGHTLRPIRLDGWQQGWIVPAGAGGTVVITNSPGQTYRRDLVVGAVLVALLLAGAFVPARRRAGAGEGRGPGPAWPAPARRLGAAARRSGLTVLAPARRGAAALRRRAGAASARPRAWARRLGRALGRRAPWWPATAAGAVLVGLVAGVAGLLVIPLSFVGRRAPAVLSWLGGAAVVGSGLGVALAADALPGSHRGAFGWIVQLCGAIAVSCVLATASVRADGGDGGTGGGAGGGGPEPGTPRDRPRRPEYGNGDEPAPPEPVATVPATRAEADAGPAVSAPASAAPVSAAPSVGAPSIGAPAAAAAAAGTALAVAPRPAEADAGQPVGATDDSPEHGHPGTRD